MKLTTETCLTKARIKEGLQDTRPKFLFNLATLFQHGIWTIKCHLKNTVNVYVIQQNVCVGVRL